MKAEEIITIMKAMEEHDLSSFELCEGNLRLALRRGHEPVILQQNAGAAPLPAMPLPAAANEALKEAPEEKLPEPSKEEASKDKGGNIVKSPLVGTFYAAASPEAEPFVKPGDKVKKGQVLGIIEAMKLMNEIESEFDGTVEEILVNNEDVVEYGQPLFRIA